MIGFSNFDDDSDVLSFYVAKFEVMFYFFSRMRMEFTRLELEIE